MACLGFAVVPAVGAAVFPCQAAAPSCCLSPPAVSAGASPFVGRRVVAPTVLPPVTLAVATRRRSCSPEVVLSASPAGNDQSPSPAEIPAAEAARGGIVSARHAGVNGGGAGGSGAGGRPWRQWAVATATAFALLVSPGAARAARRSVKTKEAPAPAAAEAVRYDGKKQLDERERAVSLVITGGAFAGLFGWAYMSNRQDDREESVRVRVRWGHLRHLGNGRKEVQCGLWWAPRAPVWRDRKGLVAFGSAVLDRVPCHVFLLVPLVLC